MIIHIIEWAIGIFFMLIFCLFFYATWWLPKKKPVPKPCPHGYEDWDDCPVCCH